MITPETTRPHALEFLRKSLTKHQKKALQIVITKAEVVVSGHFDSAAGGDVFEEDGQATLRQLSYELTDLVD